MTYKTHLGRKTDLCGRGGERTLLTTDFNQVTCKFCLGLPWTEAPLHTVVRQSEQDLRLLRKFCQYCLDLIDWREALMKAAQNELEQRFGNGTGSQWAYPLRDDVYIKASYDGTYEIWSTDSNNRYKGSGMGSGRPHRSLADLTDLNQEINALLVDVSMWKEQEAAAEHERQVRRAVMRALPKEALNAGRDERRARRVARHAHPWTEEGEVAMVMEVVRPRNSEGGE